LVNIKSTHNNENIHSNQFDQLIWDIKDGFGLTLIITNTYNQTLSDISLTTKKLRGLLTYIPNTEYSLPSLSSGQTKEIFIPIFGIGIGLVTELPSIELILDSTIQPNLQITMDLSVFGPFTQIKSLFTNKNESYPGYTLFAPTTSTTTYLINNTGDVIKTWNSNHLPAKSVYLLEDGNLLRTAYPGPHPIFIAGGVGGRIETIDQNGTIQWTFDYNTNNHCLHHDIEPLPNGNILMISWEINSYTESIDAGRNPNILPVGGLWSDHIIEVKPISPTSGEIVWEWHVWDHLIQNYDPSKENYGVISDHPELIDINYGNERISDWNHINSIDYHETYDQILLSVNAFNEIWVIDHSTTTEEAANHTGGLYGKGGDILYRWGNPQTYGHGQSSDQYFYSQHDAQWIQTDHPGENNILVFNNGVGRPTFDYSSVDEIEPPINQQGYYTYTPGIPYDPIAPIWTYTSEDPTNLFALIISGAQRLPNGNTLICDGPKGRFFEVTPSKNIIWEYSNPYPDPTFFNRVFKIYRYSEDYPGLPDTI
jgi:hypothetical protein